MSEEEIVRLQMTPVLIIGQDGEDNVVCAIAELPDSPAVLGMMLADVVRHAANFYCGEEPSAARAKTIMEIASAFNMEMSDPTSDPCVITRSGRMNLGEVQADYEEGDDDT